MNYEIRIVMKSLLEVLLILKTTLNKTKKRQEELI